MVQAILAGNKTQTRRVITPQPEVRSGTKAPIDREAPGSLNNRLLFSGIFH
jgi:hypothetical protein